MKEPGYAAFDALRTPANPNDNYSLAYAEFVVPLVKAVQELAAGNAALEQRNKAMKDETEERMARMNERLAEREHRLGEVAGTEQIRVCPVPANDLVRLELPLKYQGLGATMELRDAEGRTVEVRAIGQLAPYMNFRWSKGWLMGGSKHLEPPLWLLLRGGAGGRALPCTARIAIAH